MSNIEISSLFNIGLITVKKYIDMDETKIPSHSNQIRGREHSRVMEKTIKKIELVKSLKKEGKSITEIQRLTSISYGAIKKYLQKDFIPRNKHYGQDKEGVLPSNKKDIIKLYLAGKTSPEIANYIKEKTSHKITSEAVRSFILKEKRVSKDLNISLLESDTIDSKTIKKLFYFGNDCELILPQFQLDEIIEKYPLIGTLLKVVSSFKEILFSNNSSKLDNWVQEVYKLNIEQLTSYVNSLIRDIDAIKNAIDNKYNNGIAEGKVNLIKLIKRTMFGRCNFDTLKWKILLHENSFEIV